MKPRRQELWRRLIEATLESIAVRGFPATTVAHITDIAGVSRTQFYFLFQDKDECFLATQAAVFGEIETRIRDQKYDGLQWPQQLQLGIDTIMQLIDESPALTRVLLVESSLSTPEAQANHQLGMTQLAALVDRGRELAPESRFLPSETGEMALGSALAILSREYHRGEQARFPQMAPSVAYGLLMPYLGPDEASRQVAQMYPDRPDQKPQS